MFLTIHLQLKNPCSFEEAYLFDNKIFSKVFFIKKNILDLAIDMVLSQIGADNKLYSIAFYSKKI